MPVAELEDLRNLKPTKWHQYRTDEYRTYRRAYRKRDRKLNPEKNLQADRRHRDRHRETLNARARVYYLKNREDCLARNKSYCKRNRVRRLAKKKEWIERNISRVRDCSRLRRLRPGQKLRSNLSIGIRLTRQGRLKGVKTMELLGCSLHELIKYLESKFRPGMSWENYGFKGWHVDHIIPCASFDLTKIEHLKRCFHFSNLQPLWAKDNLSKHDKIVTNQFNLL